MNGLVGKKRNKEMNVFTYGYEEVKDFWDYSTSRGNSTIYTKEDYVRKIIDKFNLKKIYHYKYLCQYFDRYMAEKGRV